MKIKAKSGLSFFNKLVLFFNYLAAIALLISYLASVTDPKDYWFIAFFGLAYPLLLLINILFITYWIFRLKSYLLLSLICILIGWKILHYNFGFHNNIADGPKSSDTHIRIMTYNVHGFTNLTSFGDVPTKKKILRLINEQQPDIISIEEFYTRRKGQFKIIDSLKEILHTDQYYFQSFNTQATDAAGLAIFTKYQIINTGFIKLSNNNSDNQVIFADLKSNNKIFRVYCLHLQSIRLQDEDHKYVDSVSQNGTANIRSSKRIGSKLKLAFIKRSQQVAIIKSHAAQCPYPYIFSGDFNDTPTSFAVNQMKNGLKNAFDEQGSGLGRTYNGDVPNFQIDYIMVSPQFDVINYKIIEKRLSDHYPVRSDLLLK